MEQDQTMDKPTILIVDDQKDFVSAMLKRLHRRDIYCRGAYTGEEALESIRGHDFEVVLLDMKLPDLDGNKVLREIKKMKPATRVIILTGHASGREGEAGLAEGAVDYLLKPVEFEVLFEKLFAGNKKPARGSPGTDLNDSLSCL